MTEDIKKTCERSDIIKKHFEDVIGDIYIAYEKGLYDAVVKLSENGNEFHVPKYFDDGIISEDFEAASELFDEIFNRIDNFCKNFFVNTLTDNHDSTITGFTVQDIKAAGDFETYIRK